jgi:hypothetical protein
VNSERIIAALKEQIKNIENELGTKGENEKVLLLKIERERQQIERLKQQKVQVEVF